MIENINMLIDDSNPLSFILGGIGSVIIYIIIMVCLVFLFYKKEKALDFCGRHLTYAFIAVWILGFAVYDIGMYAEYSLSGVSKFSALLGVAPMAIIDAFAMFALQSDVSAIHNECFNSSWFMFFFSIAHFLAAFISMVFVIKHFGFNIVSTIIRYWKTHFWVGEIQDLFVFWGMNDATYYLAKDIVKEKKNINSKIIIVRINNEKENANERLGIERLFSFLSLTKNNLENLQELQKMGCLTVSTFGSLTNILVTNNMDILRYELRLHGLVRLIKHTKGIVHMLFLDKDNAFNIQAVDNLRQDKEIIDFAQQGQIKFYCHARYNSIHRVIEDELTHEHIEVKVIDSSHISVELLKKNPALHPVNYVTVEQDATVSSPFNALVVGFGEVGLDAVRFLYEFGAFVKSHDKNEGTRSDFCCHVIDKEMDLGGLFVANTPAIKTTMNRNEDEENKLINLYKMDCKSVGFYEKLETWIKTLNYIVIATGDDETNISLAIRIFRLSIREREDDLKRLRILVRIQHDENGHIKKIAEHYNRLWEAELKSERDNKLHQKLVSLNCKLEEPITLFGSTESIYTYNHIIDETLKEHAKKFKEKYDQCINELKRISNKKPDVIQTWDEQQNDLMQLTGENKGYSPTFSGVMKLRRIQHQNIANSLHGETKIILAQKALGLEAYEKAHKHGLVRKDGSLTYTWSDHSSDSTERIQRVLDVLAQTEHLRWNASHEILGYQNEGNEVFKDEAKLKHGCLKEWKELSKETQSYDYNIVDVSLNIIRTE